jgi:endonuclease/exonuclease/phosphatase family metal-dependent hydrolase
VDLDAVVAGVWALGVDLLAVQEVDRQLARSGRLDPPAAIAQALGGVWFWSYAPALVGDDFRPLSGPDPGGPAYGNQLVSRLPLAGSSTCGSPGRWGEQRSALVGTVQVGSRPVTVAATHVPNRQGHNVRQLRELRGLTAARVAPRLLVGDLNMPSTSAAAGLSSRLAGDRTGPDLAQFRPDPAARPCSTQRPGRGHPAPRHPGGRRLRQRPPRPGGRARHRSQLTRRDQQLAFGARRTAVGPGPLEDRVQQPRGRVPSARRNRSGRGRALSAIRIGEEVSMDKGRRPFRLG